MSRYCLDILFFITRTGAPVPLPVTTVLVSFAFTTAEPSIKIGLLKYNGGGDWYANPTALPNLIQFCNAEINTKMNLENLNKNLSLVEKVKKFKLIKDNHI